MSRRLKNKMIVRPAGLGDDRDDSVTPEDVRGDEEEALVVGFRRRGRVGRVVRRPHVDHYLNLNLDLISEELIRLRKIQAERPDGLAGTDIQRMKDLNEMMIRCFREEREQTKLDRMEDLEDEDLEQQWNEAVEKAARELLDDGED